MIEVVNLAKRYGRIWVLQDINLRIQRGEVLVLFGDNGSGKTSLLNQFAMISKPSQGELFLDGKNLKKSFSEGLGMVPHNPFLYSSLSIRENLDFFGSLYGLKKSLKEMRIDALSSVFELFDYLDRPVRQLSEGLVKRVSIVRAIIHDPEVILMDEPFVCLDGKFTEKLTDILKGGFSLECLNRKPEKRFFVFSTHNLERALDIGSKIGVLNAGKLIALDDVENLSSERIYKLING
ncbi:MAG: ABC transporter ATP-binding protein [Nitrospinota bacterium]|nr:ABC transporter ATP-binding protein [Nitrospinota bacterium]